MSSTTSSSVGVGDEGGRALYPAVAVARGFGSVGCLKGRHQILKAQLGGEAGLIGC
ncbi:hypothetical protein [Streptomyces capitiformicae]|uniref:hypothetical protein n=1 Tax=Streptomyces capitiformicae TaxID=2014920 RepID=UPI0016793767|nr:hypothetical protein [Streptomyces capitiformicae]